MQAPWVVLRSATFHPFIFQRMIAAASDDALPGMVVTVYDKHGYIFGRGLYNGRSQIALRMLTWSDEPIDEGFWRGRLASAIDFRRRLRLDEVTDAYRLVHAEGDALSGLIAERYGDCIVLELFSLGMYERRRMLAEMLAALLGPPARLERPDLASPQWRVIVRADAAIEGLEGFRVSADENRGAPGNLIIREHGLRYRVDPTVGHKTGFFCDQRDNRLRFARLCQAARVLDMCCYSAGFGLCAKKLGGASEVTSVDLDEAALAMARENANLNQARLDLVHADAFIYLRQMMELKRRYDAVVLDPPKLALSRAQLDEALRRYHDMNALAMQVVAPGGFFLTCSCSGLVSAEQFRATVLSAGRRAGRVLVQFDQSAAAPDHPVRANCPESAYLKALWFRIL